MLIFSGNLGRVSNAPAHSRMDAPQDAHDLGMPFQRSKLPQLKGQFHETGI